MTEQQQHLKELLQKREELQKELEQIQVQGTFKRELFLKIQGIIEYLTQIGVTLPPEETEDSQVTQENEPVQN